MEAKVVKISQKIGLERFVDILKQKPEKVIISQSILDQVKSLRLATKAIQHAYENPVKIEIVRKGNSSKVIAQDWMDPFIRELVGTSPTEELELEFKLLEKGAISEEAAISINELDGRERRLLNKLIKMEHVLLTSESKVHLT